MCEVASFPFQSLLSLFHSRNTYIERKGYDKNLFLFETNFFIFNRAKLFFPISPCCFWGLRALLVHFFSVQTSCVCQRGMRKMENNVSNRSTRHKTFIISLPVVNCFFFHADQLPPSFPFSLPFSRTVSFWSKFLRVRVRKEKRKKKLR